MKKRKTQGNQTLLQRRGLGSVWTRQGSCVWYQARGTGSQDVGERVWDLRTEEGDLKRVLKVGQEPPGVPQAGPSGVTECAILRRDVWWRRWGWLLRVRFADVIQEGV